MVTLFLGSLALASPAQTGFEAKRDEQEWAFSVQWRGARGAAHSVAFRLPAESVDADREEVTWFPRKAYHEHVVKEVRVWSKDLKGVDVTAAVKNDGVVIGVKGPAKRAKTVLAKAQTVRDAASASWLADNSFFEMKDGLSFDHAKLVNTYADDLSPLATALDKGISSSRDYSEKALSFVQAIPYEARKRNGKDPGYRRPLALLSRNRGDCDSKAVLYLALIRAEYPELPLAVVYVPGHALVGVGVPPDADDRTFEVAGTTFVMAEPVGPALFPMGETDKANRKAGKRGEVRVVAPVKRAM